MKASMLSRGFFLGLVASLTLATAMAGPPNKGVPTMVVPRQPAPVPVPVAKTSPPPAQMVPTCRWEEEPAETVVTSSRQVYSPGIVIDAYCVPMISLSPIMSTVPESVIRTTGKNLDCNPR